MKKITTFAVASLIALAGMGMSSSAMADRTEIEGRVGSVQQIDNTREWKDSEVFRNQGRPGVVVMHGFDALDRGEPGDTEMVCIGGRPGFYIKYN